MHPRGGHVVAQDQLMLFTCVYALLGACFVWPPRPFVSLGWTVEGLFGKALGNKNLNFLTFQVRRTTAALFTHGVLVLGYMLGALWIRRGPAAELLAEEAAWSWSVQLAVCVWCAAAAVAVAMMALAAHWRLGCYANHPVAKALAAYSQQSWILAVSAIETEFRRIDKVMLDVGQCTVVATDSWLLQVRMYNVDVAQLRDVDMSIVGSSDVEALETSERIQFLTIRVTSLRAPPFSVRLRALDFERLQAKLTRQVRNAQNIIIQQSLSDQFVAEFRRILNENQVFVPGPEVEPDTCAGCMTNPASVKIVRHCVPLGDRAPCGDCYCRPMWCDFCLGKWFVSSQNEHRPETWLSGTALCPTCRARFCVFDVCRVAGVAPSPR